jgi:phosphatidylserine decarboxylase
MDALFIFLQGIVPQHLLSRCTGWLADLRHPVWLKNWVIKRFVAHYRVAMGEAAQPDPTAYENFNAFFTRALRDGVRPLGLADIVCPADGTISQLGAIEEGRVFQAKGQNFTVLDLLGGDRKRAAWFEGGEFATIYLSPRDYHRVHMPMAGRLTATHYIPGELFSVNAVTAERVERLFARNERHVCYFETEAGPMAMVLVGAMVVAGIETVWEGQVAPPVREATVLRDWVDLPEPVQLDKGTEMGRFKLGSTVILLFPPDSIVWDAAYQAGAATRMGEKLASLAR